MRRSIMNGSEEQSLARLRNAKDECAQLSDDHNKSLGEIRDVRNEKSAGKVCVLVLKAML